MKEMKDYVNEIEEKLNTGETTIFKKFRYYKAADAWNTQVNRESNICPEKHTIVVMFDEDNAIIESFREIIEGYKYSFIANGIKGNCYYKSIDAAILGYLGRKYHGANEHFSEFAYRALTGEDL